MCWFKRAAPLKSFWPGRWDAKVVVQPGGATRSTISSYRLIPNSGYLGTYCERPLLPLQPGILGV